MARYPRFAAAVVPSYRPKPESDLGRAVVTGSSADASSPMRLFAPVDGQYRWRSEGRRHPHRPSPLPDALFADPDFALTVGAMTS